MLNRRKVGSVAAGAVALALCSAAVVKSPAVRAAQPAAVVQPSVAVAMPTAKPAAVHALPRIVRQDPLRGLATWYGSVLHGHRTASGEIFDETELTAASRTLPMGSRVRVSDVSTGRSVIVRINDRGTLAPGRIIDLSSAAATILGILERGVAQVKLEVLHAVDAASKDHPEPKPAKPDGSSE